MNGVFLHNRVQALEALLQGSTEAFRAHDGNPHAATAHTLRFLDDAAAAYAGLGLGVAENESVGLRAEVAGAGRRGHAGPADTSPLGRRRDAERRVALWALTESGKRLRAQLDRDNETLTTAREEVVRLLHHAAEQGLIDLTRPVDGNGARTIWRTLATDAGTRSAASWLALRVAIPDVLLLIQERIGAVSVSGDL